MNTYDRAPSSPPRLSRRVRACKPCRAAKVRCSGGRPCARCTRRSDSCTWIADEAVVSVSEKYLRDLQQQLSESQTALREVRSRSGDRHESFSSQPLSAPPPRVTSVSAPRASTTLLAPPPETSAPRPRDIVDHRRTQSGQSSQLSPSWSASVASADVPSYVTGTSASLARSWESQAIDSTPGTLDKQSTTGPRARRGIQARQARSSFAGKDFAYVSDTHSTRFLFLGPTSTWTFSRRAFTLLENASTDNSTPHAPLNLDGAAFRLRWQPKAEVTHDDVLGLPPMDYALFLYNAVKFRFGELFCLIHEKEFMRHFEEFHLRPLETARQHNLWFVEYLLVLAFGKAFTATQNSQSRTIHGPKGAHLAARALSLLPNIAFLQEERPALQAIRSIALAALYFHAIDMRSPAYQYIGQAIRLSFHDGLHRLMPDDIGPDMILICSNTWWAICIIDQEITAGLGCPANLTHGYITTPTPELLSSGALAQTLSLRARLSELMSTISSHSYGFDHNASSEFIRNTTPILHSLAELSQDVDQVVSVYRSSGGEPPHMFHNVALCYNHCIVIATRPLIICLLYRSLPPNHFEPQQLDGPAATLLATSAQSATTVLSILDDLVQRESIETFLPFQLECAFSSAVLLSLLSAFAPSYVPKLRWLQMVLGIIDFMISKGNVVAKLRKVELEHLETLLKPYRSHESMEELSAITTTSGDNLPDYAEIANQGVHEQVAQAQPCAASVGVDNWWWDSNTANIGGDDLLALAEEFEHDGPGSWTLFDQPM